MKDKPFTYFPADTADPCEKYKQPESVDTAGLGYGYPQTDINRDGIMVKGRWPAGTSTKTTSTARGGGAATKGCDFFPDD